MLICYKLQFCEFGFVMTERKKLKLSRSYSFLCNAEPETILLHLILHKYLHRTRVKSCPDLDQPFPRGPTIEPSQKRRIKNCWTTSSTSLTPERPASTVSHNGRAISSDGRPVSPRRPTPPDSRPASAGTRPSSAMTGRASAVDVRVPTHHAEIDRQAGPVNICEAFSDNGDITLCTRVRVCREINCTG